MDLCKSCAEEKNVSDPSDFSMANLLFELSAGGNAEETKAAAGSSDLKCEGCGMTQSDFKKSGRLGCSRCYETFEANLMPLLKGMHKGEQHIGKVPPGFSTNQVSAEKLKLLRRELDAAVRSENFEAAAQIRDRIRKLEQEKNVAP